MSNKILRYTLSSAGVLLMPASAQAHAMSVATTSWIAGFTHPFMGLDHVLAMLAVGLWSVQQGRRSFRYLPAAFLGAMVLGAYAGLNGLSMPAVESGLLASSLVLGFLLASAARLSNSVSMSLVAFFALFHGYAHGAEMPQSVGALVYAGGFLFSAAVLLGMGVAAGMAVYKARHDNWLRISGLAFGIAGGLLCL
ncbi:MAG: HupE/UreJ family protein [Gammaproteobacteria bacterium]